MVERIRVIIADDHPLYREGVRGSLLALAGCEVGALAGLSKATRMKAAVFIEELLF